MNNDQKIAFDAVLSGKNIFITGSAGTGKSFLITSIISWAHSTDKNIGITSSTASSAVLIRGKTLHSFMGIGLANKDACELARDIIIKKKLILSKLRSLDILIIDEISMVDSRLLDKISEILQILRKKDKPFGGVQVVFTGDFCQLKPVNGDDFAFQSKAWTSSNITTVMLTKQMRQVNDDTFAKILEELRFGACSDETLSTLKKLSKTQFEGDILPTVLYAKNVDVDEINRKKYEALVQSGASSRKYSTDVSSHPYAKSWMDSNKLPENIEICIGAQVVVTANIDPDNHIVNGSRGIVVSLGKTGPNVKLVDGRTVTISKFKFTAEDDERLHAKYIPLKLAWSMTIYKSQGMTIDRMILSLDFQMNCGAPHGIGYVGLSRSKSLDSVRLLHVKKSSFRCDSDVKKFYKELAQ